ncbi:MAG: zinc ribbon domain-containing protein [Leptolyngbya sp. SIOISBB]|nr:zinc ribbon domain-containing protein [Leptolyngbya sp. SIOISBB]
MAYTCELGSGQRLYLDNVGEQTAVTLASSSAGQQQQSGSQFATGAWTAPPEMFRTPQGVVIKLTTTQGMHHLQLQGSQLGVMSQSPALGNAQQMQMSSGVAMPGTAMPPMEPMQPMQPMQPMTPMEPMQPMQPMKMGDMEMNANPMQMRMGNMEMQMGSAAASSIASGSSTAGKAKFCSQCGTPVKPSDRFCANCGHQLNG